ncbi:MAG: CcmD family protein [Acidobacteria bacterium]|nr:CcmD family protein [Acidobacteriota bacterium]MBI3264342.1 CcmD family protein [Acidobacteriota bacterium]
MKRSLRWLLVVLCIVCITDRVSEAQPKQPPRGQDEFVPVNDLPPSEQLPAAPLLVAAYAFVWVVLFAYVWSLWRRLGQVEREIAQLDARGQPRTR